MRPLTRTLVILALLLISCGYPASYAALRFTHYFVHAGIFISEEGYNARYWHFIEGHDETQRIFAPLISAEVWCWEHWKP
ncbi:MAG: hypothetical protein QM817_41245 [Archangium sp.]